VNGIVQADVERYLEDLAHREHDHPVLDEMEQRARRTDFPYVGRTVGRLLEQQARAVAARRVFELGSGFGYSAYWFARAVGGEGEVVCTDLDRDNAAAAERFLAQAGLWDRIRFQVGEAGDALAAADGEFDVVFNDADKQHYPDHWRAAADRVRVGGLYLCDNALWYGRVATGQERDDDRATAAVAEHNRLVADDRRYVSSLLPLRDGVLVALRIA
jgi:caffeoyl-CoA O-methyltransferase